ncbi:MAG: hypothetical protein WCX73_02070 [Candidatus Pacearchaeota archaeon]|jgi:hypothetical protein
MAEASTQITKEEIAKIESGFYNAVSMQLTAGRLGYAFFKRENPEIDIPAVIKFEAQEFYSLLLTSGKNTLAGMNIENIYERCTENGKTILKSLAEKRAKESIFRKIKTNYCISNKVSENHIRGELEQKLNIETEEEFKKTPSTKIIAFGSSYLMKRINEFVGIEKNDYKLPDDETLKKLNMFFEDVADISDSLAEPYSIKLKKLPVEQKIFVKPAVVKPAPTPASVPAPQTKQSEKKSLSIGERFSGLFKKKSN